MRPRNLAAGALCLAITAAGAEAALAQTETPQSTTEPSARTAQEPRIAVRHRKLHVSAGNRTAVSGRVTAGPARRALEADRPGSH